MLLMVAPVIGHFHHQFHLHRSAGGGAEIAAVAQRVQIDLPDDYLIRFRMEEFFHPTASCENPQKKNDSAVIWFHNVSHWFLCKDDGFIAADRPGRWGRTIECNPEPLNF